MPAKGNIQLQTALTPVIYLYLTEGNLDIMKDQPKDLSRNNSVQLDVKYIQNQYQKMWLNIAYVHSEVRLGRWGEDALTVPRPFCI